MQELSSSMPRLLLMMFALSWFASSVQASSIIRLKNGSEIKGEIISDHTDRIVVDLGFTVLTVPRDEVGEIAKESAATTVKDGVGEQTSDLYHTNSSQSTLSVKENVERCGGAVVQVSTPTGLGSGFVIDPQGYVVTNEHVVAGEYQITVTLFRRGSVEQEKVQFKSVRIVAMDARLDLALLKIEDAGNRVFQTVPVGDSNGLNEGQTVFAIGSPLGLERSVSQGIISLKNRALDGFLFLQTTTQINPNAGFRYLSPPKPTKPSSS